MKLEIYVRLEDSLSERVRKEEVSTENLERSACFRRLELKGSPHFITTDVICSVGSGLLVRLLRPKS